MKELLIELCTAAAMVTCPNLVFENSLDRYYGITRLYNSGRIEIAINTRRAWKPEQQKQVLIHEIAHAKMLETHGSKHDFHGNKWKSLCLALGGYKRTGCTTKR